jgi:hypothetical protein
MAGVSNDPCQCGMVRSAGGGAAGSVARMSVSRGEASGSWPARAGISTRVEIRHTWNRDAQRQLGAGARRNIKGPTDTNTDCPSRDKPGTCGDVDKEPKGENGPGRGRAGRYVQSGRTTFRPVPVLRTSTTGRTVQNQSGRFQQGVSLVQTGSVEMLGQCRLAGPLPAVGP